MLAQACRSAAGGAAPSIGALSTEVGGHD
jgi:hypothetical protein